MFKLRSYVRVVPAKRFGVIVSINRSPDGYVMYEVYSENEFKEIREYYSDNEIVDADEALKAFNAGYYPISNKKRWAARVNSRDVKLNLIYYPKHRPFFEPTLAAIQKSRLENAQILRDKKEDVVELSPDTYRCLKQLWAEAPGRQILHRSFSPQQIGKIGTRVYGEDPPAPSADFYAAACGETIRFISKNETSILVSNEDHARNVAALDMRQFVEHPRIDIINIVNPGSPAPFELIDKHVMNVLRDKGRDHGKLNKLIAVLRRGDPKMPDKKLQRYARYLYDIAHGLR